MGVRRTFLSISACAALGFAPAVAAVPGLDALTVSTAADGGQTYTVSLQVLALMTVLSFLPAALVMMTAFTRIVVVLAILRQALGTAQTPSNQVLLGLALFLTMFVMTPVFQDVNGNALQPYLAEEISFQEGVMRAVGPVREFMLSHTRTSDLALFTELSGDGPAVDVDGVSLSTLMPAFVISELKTAFQIGFLVFLPFLIIDLVVASVLMSMGMMMLSPLIISFPFKIMLFILVDGWALIVGTLATSFLV